MRIIIALMAVLVPSEVFAKTTYLVCTYDGAETARITLNEDAANASLEQGSVSKTVSAIYSPNMVRIFKSKDALGGQTIEVSRVTLASKIVISIGNQNVTINGSCKLLAAPPRAF